MESSKTVFPPVDHGAPLMQHDKLRVLASYHVHKPVTRVTHEDITTTVEMLKGRRTINIEERKEPKSLTLDNILDQCLGEWAAEFKRPASKRTSNNPNTSEKDKAEEKRLLAATVEPEEPEAEAPKSKTPSAGKQVQRDAETIEEDKL